MKLSRLLLLASASLSLAASTPDELDATKLSCAQFRELGLNAQSRVLSFLQGFAHRDVPEAKVGSVPIGAGLQRVLDGCAGQPSASVWSKLEELEAGPGKAAPGDARLTRPPTEITCRAYQKLGREDRRFTVYWLDGYSRKPDPIDANQSVVSLQRKAEDFADTLCSKRQQRLWWAIQGGVRSVAPSGQPPSSGSSTRWQ